MTLIHQILLEIRFYRLKSVGGCEGLPLGVLGRKFGIRQLLNELFFVWGMDNEILTRAGRWRGDFWGSGMPSSFL